MELVSQKSRMEDRVGQQQVALALAVLERDEAVRVPEEKREGGGSASSPTAPTIQRVQERRVHEAREVAAAPARRALDAVGEERAREEAGDVVRALVVVPARARARSGARKEKARRAGVSASSPRERA